MLGFPYDYMIMAILSCAVGFIGGYAGIAGSPFFIFFLTMFFGFTQHSAQGTVLAVMMGPMTLFGIMALWDSLKPYIKHAIVGVLTYAVFSYLGGTIAYLFDERILKILFGCFLIFLAVRGFVKVRSNGGNEEDENKKPLIPFNLLAISIIGAFVGVVGGLFGIGAGVLMVPIFVSVFGLHKDSARAITLAILLPPVSIGAVLKYQSMGDVNWVVAGILFVSFFSVNYFGAKFGKRHSAKTFNTVFSFILLLLGVVTITLALNVF